MTTVVLIMGQKEREALDAAISQGTPATAGVEVVVLPHVEPSQAAEILQSLGMKDLTALDDGIIVVERGVTRGGPAQRVTADQIMRVFSAAHVVRLLS
jgi:hypothetical protein